jgi:hypothetical protein
MDFRLSSKDKLLASIPDQLGVLSRESVLADMPEIALKRPHA